MADQAPDMSAQVANLLVPYRGQKPPAPDWFTRAVETPYETHFVSVGEVQIRYQTWGDRAKPGLLLSHGNGAHAHWYDFIAPALAEQDFVVAMTFSGMGDSGWREVYSLDGFSDEQIAVGEHVFTEFGHVDAVELLTRHQGVTPLPRARRIAVQLA